MKIEKRQSPSTDKVFYQVEFEGYELMTYPPSRFIDLVKETWEKSGRISDFLMYLSEVAKAIEDHKETK